MSVWADILRSLQYQFCVCDCAHTHACAAQTLFVSPPLAIPAANVLGALGWASVLPACGVGPFS